MEASILVAIVVAVVAVPFGLYLYRYGWYAYRNRLVEQAYSNLRERNFDRAIVLAEKAIKELPKDYRPLLALSGVYANMGNYEGWQFCEKATALAPSSHELLINRVVIQLHLNKPGAIEEANQAVELFPSFNSFYIRACALLASRRYNEALADCNSMIALDDSQQLGFLIRATVHAQLKNLHQAWADCEQCLAIVSQEAKPWEVAPALLLQSQLQYARGLMKEAIETVNQSISLDDAAHARMDRAIYRSMLNEFDEATIDLDIAEQKEPETETRALIFSQRARIAFLRENVDLALELANQAISILILPTVLCTRALCWIRKADYDKATADLDQAISMDSYCAEAYGFKAKVLQAQGEQEQASIFEQKAQELLYTPRYL